MSDSRSPLTRARDGALDVVFYGPVGLVVAIGEKMPELALEGREVVSKRVQLYRMVGQMAVRHGQARISARFGRPEPAEPLALAPGSTPATSADGAPDAPSAETVQQVAPEPAAPPPPPAEPPPEVPAAIADYDSLAASQVVARLAGLSGRELEAVRRYEEHHRGRRTILGKIHQLQTAA
jgi:hypothetical protein